MPDHPMPSLPELIHTSSGKQASSTETAARADLRAALAAVPAKVATAREAQLRADRCLDIVSAAHNSLAAFDDFDDEVASFHRSATSTHLDASKATLPAHLVERRRGRTEARERLNEAEAFHAVLTEEAADDAAAVKVATAAIAAAGGDVLRAVANARAERLLEVEAWAGRERILLCDAADSMSNDERLQSPAILGLLRTPWGASLMNAVQNERQRLVGRWSALRADLRTDPEAALDTAAQG